MECPHTLISTATAMQAGREISAMNHNVSMAAVTDTVTVKCRMSAFAGPDGKETSAMNAFLIQVVILLLAPARILGSATVVLDTLEPTAMKLCP